VLNDSCHEDGCLGAYMVHADHDGEGSISYDPILHMVSCQTCSCTTQQKKNLKHQSERSHLINMEIWCYRQTAHLKAP
jgi:hypothetical protein